MYRFLLGIEEYPEGRKASFLREEASLFDQR